MKRNFKIIAGVLAAVILVAVTGTAVMAATPTPTPGLPAWCVGGGRGGWGWAGDGIDVVSKLTGLTEEEIITQRQAGKTLVEIAATKGITEEALITAILADRKADLQALVTAGTVTQAHADWMFDNMEARIAAMVQSNTYGAGIGCGGGGGCGAGGFGRGFANSSAPRGGFGMMGGRRGF